MSIKKDPYNNATRTNDAGFCIYGWIFFPNRDEVHELQLDGLLSLNRNIENLQIEDLICDPHKINLKYEFDWTRIHQEKFDRFLRASNFCKLHNLGNLIPYMSYNKTQVLKLEQTIKTIIKSKFTANEKRGYF